jgi:hypothetical protein
MKTLILLAAIFGVVAFGVIEQHQHNEAADREAAEQQLHRCWQVAMSNDGVGADICKGLADNLNK